MFDRGVFTLSFDVELAWGELHRRRSATEGVERLLEARTQLEPLLELLGRHDIAATFAFVGHLLDEQCPGHADDPRPSYDFGPDDWYGVHPRGGEAEAPAWYGLSLAQCVREAPTGHELGAHGYTHAPFLFEGATRELARSEFSRAAEVLERQGIEPVSFVFPMNRIDYLEVLQEQGFRCFRTLTRRAYTDLPRPLRRVGHGLEQLLAVTPPTGLPVRRAGLWELPSSMLFLSREAWRRWIPVGSRVRRALKGLERAARRREVFHLWMHLADLVPGSALMLDGLGRVFEVVAERRAAGAIEVLTMGGLAARMETCTSSASVR